MNKTRLIALIIIVVIIGYGSYYFYSSAVSISGISLSSPDNSAIKEDIQVRLNKPAKLYIEYWKEGSSQHIKTPISIDRKEHTIHLLLLEAASTYHYRVVLDRAFDVKSKVMTFQTRKQSPWMIHDWIKGHNPHDEKALGNGLVMLCYRGYPGYIAMVDGKGAIRWYWQDDKLGVRVASLTPRGTVLALLAPASKDEFNKPQTNSKVKRNAGYYLRSGKTGFVGGTELAEINLAGKVLWRINLEKKGIIMHHDLRMNKAHHIVGVVRDFKLWNLKGKGTAQDTLWGDAIMEMDTTGKVLKKWSAWDVWDISKDTRMDSLKHDRFHFNTISFDTDSNYLISSPIENQIWKVNPTSGKVVWKLGKGGDFKMDENSYFYFQHAPHVNEDGDLMLFDNGDFSPKDTSTVHKRSRALSFRLDTVNMVATAKINAPIPKKQYTARMGSAYLLPNKRILQTSSKTGGVLLTDTEGKVLWELNTYFIPYRAEYVPKDLWSKYMRTNE